MKRSHPAFYAGLFTVLALLYSLTVPLFEGNDESWHYAYVRYVAEHWTLPRQPPDQYPHLARQEASQPPLFYLLAAALTRWVPQGDLADLYRRENPFPALLPIGHRDNQNHYIHTDAERFPYRGAALAIRLARLLSILFGAGTVWGTYVLARRLFPQKEWVAAGAAMTVALTPGFLFTSSLVNNDALAACIATWTLVVLAPHPSPAAFGGTSFRRGWSEAGLLLGAAALTKLSGLLLWPFAALALVFYHQDTKTRSTKNFFFVSSRLRGFLLTFGIALAVCGWWYGRNWHLYGDPTGLAAMLPLVGRREPGFGLMDFFQTEARLVWMSYWAVFGWFNLAAPGWVYWVYGLLVALGAAGLVLFGARAARRKDWGTLGRVGYLLLWALIVAVGLVRWTLTTGGSQGRLLYPAIGAHATLLALGWVQLAPARARRWLFLALGALLLALALWMPFGVIRPAYARPAPLTMTEVEERVSHRADIRFGESITLLGYRVEAEEIRPGHNLPVILCWRADGPVGADYFVSLSLQTVEGLTAGQKITHPGLGTFPTSLWSPGVAFCDRYLLPVRETVPRTTIGTLAVGLTTFTERLPVYNKGGWQLGDTFHFPGPRVVVPDSGPVLDYRWGREVALVGYRLERGVLAPGEELELTLYWRALRPLDGPRSATVQVLQGDDKIAQTDLPLNLKPGEFWADHRRMPLAADAPPGVYTIGVAVYDPTGRATLPVYEHGRALPAGSLLSLWEVRVREPLPYAKDTQNLGEIPVDIRFGEIIHLIGYTVSSEHAWPGDAITVTLYWRLLTRADRPVNGFVHLLGTTVNPATGNLLWGEANQQLPVHWWEVGKVYEDTYTFQIAPDAPAGEYWLEVGWWDPYTWERYPPDIAGGEAVLSEWNSVLLRRMRIP
ncbi:MAG: glycosyltransferase family 39 protein [Anaerolineae bacterium]|nr:glycosyltransferase family 39 protein [Anaerolineae bacterium]